ncbi:MAG: YdeI/OmpD-associated family protein [Verrucomicrobiota bacterium]
MIDDLERVQVTSAEQLRTWFEAHHAQPESIWLVTYKKCRPEKYLPNTEIVDACVAFGWVDGRRKVLDEERTMQLLAPRKTDKWSQSYQVRYQRLLKEGKMHSAGLRAVQAAQASGGWEAFREVDALRVPQDLGEALKKVPPALKHFEAFPPSARRDILRWIELAKRKETRARRILETVAKAERNERASGTGAKK